MKNKIESSKLKLVSGENRIESFKEIGVNLKLDQNIIEDITDSTSLIAIQGPSSRDKIDYLFKTIGL